MAYRQMTHKPEDENKVVDYVSNLADKMNRIMETEQEKDKASKTKTKCWYDRKARDVEYTEGDEVPVLLPASANKLLAGWQVPYKKKITKRLGKSHIPSRHAKGEKKLPIFFESGIPVIGLRV